MNKSLICLSVCSVFTLGLSATEFQRSPYVQLATQDSITLVWRTNKEIKPTVRYGKSHEKLEFSLPLSNITTRKVAEAGLSEIPLWSGPQQKMVPHDVVQYEAKIANLKTHSRYYYAIYDGEKRLTPEDVSYQFTTHPEIGKSTATRFWVVGDSGTGGKKQQQVHQGMRKFVSKGDKKLDFYLHVGDMAYGSGYDQEFSKKFFSMYEPTLRNTVCWASMGNHEGYTSNGKTGKGPYYDAYVLPSKAEAGGVASGTEAYYSFDYGDAHFICLNSHDLDRSTSGAMAKWLKADLDKTKAQWLIAFFHHPPYTKGSHDSDKERQLIEMRKYIMPILETGGVDAVFTGHSHIYERSMLIDGAYSTPSTNQGVVLDDGNGNPAGDGAYRKSSGLTPNNGTVQVVTGHGGTGLKHQSNHVLMSQIIMFHGSMIMDINANKLTGKMINVDGEILDTFCIVKKGKVERKIVKQPREPKLMAPGLTKNKTQKLAKEYTSIIPQNDEWDYLAGENLYPAKDWTQIEFDTSRWKKGKAGFGYSDKDDVTILDMKDKFTSVFIRKKFELKTLENLDKLGLAISFDDGFIAYINGKEVARIGVDFGSGKTAKGFHTNEARKHRVLSLKKFKKLFNKGQNVIAIEGHNADLSSSDFSLDPFLILTK